MVLLHDKGTARQQNIAFVEQMLNVFLERYLEAGFCPERHFALSNSAVVIGAAPSVGS